MNVNQFLEQKGFEVTAVPSGEDALQSLEGGRFDVVLGGIAVTDQRRQLVDFTVSYHSTDPEEWYIGPPGAPPPASALIRPVRHRA
ncbi:MAG: amino acid ABC transporter substrate-binding protein [Sphingopyxis sp.]|nr:amino acid ABC transporter substrate-binding protein [Sphingopyxis sp.]